jgi:trehalose-phosphatase
VARFAAAIDGAHVQHGHEVVELLARSTSKGSAIAGMRRRGQPVVFVGDDVTDETVFELMDEGDLSIRVGPGDTAARYRLAGSDEVPEFLANLTA